MALKQISGNDVLLGKPLEKDIYTADGQLLLGKGSVLSDAGSKQRLMGLGYKEVVSLYERPPAAAPAAAALTESAFSLVQHAAKSLSVMLDDLLKNQHREQFIGRIRSLAARLQTACLQDPEAAIAAIHLFHEGEYAIRHHLSVGVVSALLADADGQLTRQQQHSLICAAITHDIGILTLTNQETALSEEKRKLIGQHPQSSARVLRQLGVNDPIWLEAVLEHHERLDGSGYPQALCNDQISLHGRLLAVADVYCAMTRPRPYRPKAYFPMAAMRDLYVGQSKQLDSGLIQLLIKSLGLIPPGTLVRLKNNEIAVVRKRSANNSPIVCAVYNRQGMPMVTPDIRHTNQSAYAIQGRVDYEDCRNVEAMLRRIWAN